MTKPWGLFRYRSCSDHLWSDLEHSRLHFSAPANLNDPFDCRVEWRNALQRALASHPVSNKRRRRLKRIQDAFETRDPHLTVGICCFARDLRSLLMWSHYTRSHTGVCLYYEFPAKYMNETYPPIAGSEGASEEIYFVGGSGVHYGDNAFTRWLTRGGLNEPHPGDFAENAVTRLFTSKAKGWAYEEEWRMVASRPGLLTFDPRYLKDITFGLNIADADRRRIVNIAKANNPQIIFRQAKKSTTSDFALEFDQIAN